MIKEYIYYHLKQVYPNLLPVDGRRSKSFYIEEENVWIRFNNKIPDDATYDNICFIRETEDIQFMKDYFNYYLSETTEAEMKRCLEYICNMYHFKQPSTEHFDIDYIAYYNEEYNNYINRNLNQEAKSLDEVWSDWYALLISYKKEYGNLAVPKNSFYKGENLGRWCQTTRGYYNKGSLSQDRLDKLNEIGFVWDLLDYEWNRRYEQYKRYINKTGSTVIARRTDFEGEHLGAWIHTQKLRYKEGKTSKERRIKLLSLDKHIFDVLE